MLIMGDNMVLFIFILFVFIRIVFGIFSIGDLVYVDSEFRRMIKILWLKMFKKILEKMILF